MLIYVRFYPFVIAGYALGFHRWFLKFILMDFFSLLKHLTMVNECLGLFLLFGFGLKFLCSDWLPWSLIEFLRDLIVKSGGLRNGFRLKNVLDGNWVILKFLKDDLEVPLIDETEEKRDEKSSIFTDSDQEFDAENDVRMENKHEDGEFDVSELIKLINIERRRVSAARAELEQERDASATAAAEAMAMILRLQTEKSSIELELKQYRRLALEKQIHDQQVIQSLQNLVWSQGTERRTLEHQLKLCRRNLNGFSDVNERDGFDEFEGDLSSCFGEVDDVLENVLYSSRSLDFNLSHERVPVLV